MSRGHVSLPVGETRRLPAEGTGLTWSSDNPLVRVNQRGQVRADRDALHPGGLAVITATDGVTPQEWDITVVDWPTLPYRLEVVEQPSFDRVTADADGSLLITQIASTDVRRSSDSLATTSIVGTLPETAQGQHPLWVTPFGYFFVRGDRIYRSTDLTDWTLSHNPEILMGTLQSGVCAFEHEGVGYFFRGEYSSNAETKTKRHRVYRGVIDGATETWTTVLEFFSQDERDADPLNVPAVKHVHTVAHDPYTGDVWVTTGDEGAECHIFCSRDRGDTWSVIGQGSQKWRVVGVWFTEGFAYWATDTAEAPQAIFRLPRTEYASGWPEITSEADDYSVLVAEIVQSAFMYSMWAEDDLGRDFVILTSDAYAREPDRGPLITLRDTRGRLYGVWEHEDGSNAVQELHSVAQADPEVFTPFTMLQPQAMDADGFVYGFGQDTTHNALWKLQLVREPEAARVLPGDYAFVSPTAFVPPT